MHDSHCGCPECWWAHHGAPRAWEQRNNTLLTPEEFRKHAEHVLKNEFSTSPVAEPAPAGASSASTKEVPVAYDPSEGPAQTDRDPIDVELENLRKWRRDRDEAMNDPWKHRSQGMRCKTCMWFVPKTPQITKVPERYDLGRCRRHAPTMGGFPCTFVNDWCGDHRIDENKL